jgi:hypothetical protein
MSDLRTLPLQTTEEIVQESSREILETAYMRLLVENTKLNAELKKAQEELHLYRGANMGFKILVHDLSQQLTELKK